jgi:tetratricopeptide (TPR) repeat protein
MLRKIVLLVLLPVLVFAQDAASLLKEADDHYARREEQGEIQKAIESYNKALETDSQNYVAAWKLSKSYWYLGNHTDKNKDTVFEQGIEAGKKAVAIDANSCEGHFWLGVNYALFGENSGMFKALGIVDDVKREMKRSMEINENCECGGAQRVLGKLYEKLPWFKGGSKSKSVEYLQKSLQLCPNDTQSRIFLAETYLDQGKKDQAVQQLNLVLNQQPDPSWIPETKENKIKAENMLGRLRKK